MDAERATQAAYDVLAPDYARLLPDLAWEAPVDRAVLDAFAETARAAALGPVLDVGCGTGRVAARLVGAGLRVVGVDLSVGMLAQARAAHPALPVVAGRAAALPVRTASLGGLLWWYSLVHLPAEELPAALGEGARGLRPGAPALLAFHAGAGELVDRPTAYRYDVRLTSYRHDPSAVTAALADAGLVLRGTVTRPAREGRETAPQALLLAERTA